MTITHVGRVRSGQGFLAAQNNGGLGWMGLDRDRQDLGAIYDEVLACDTGHSEHGVLVGTVDLGNDLYEKIQVMVLRADGSRTCVHAYGDRI